jgi:hypothetical protein
MTKNSISRFSIWSLRLGDWSFSQRLRRVVVSQTGPEFWNFVNMIKETQIRRLLEPRLSESAVEHAVFGLRTLQMIRILEGRIEFLAGGPKFQNRTPNSEHREVPVHQSSFSPEP